MSDRDTRDRGTPPSVHAMDGRSRSCKHVDVSTDVDVPHSSAKTAQTDSGSSRRLLWVTVILAVTLLAALAIYYVTRPPAQPTDLRSQVATYLVAVLEQSPPKHHHNHGDHPGATESARTICGVRIFGYEPADATQLADVKTVYGHHLCAMAQKGLPWDGSPKLVGPMVVDLTVNPPRVEVAEPTGSKTFAERVQELIPEQYRAQAFEESLEPDAMAELRRRYDDAAQ